MDEGVQNPEGDDDPSQQHEYRPRMMCEPSKYGEHIKEGRQFSLITIGVADLRRSLQPVQLAQPYLLGLHGSGAQIAASERPGPEKQGEGQEDFDKQRYHYGCK